MNSRRNFIGSLLAIGAGFSILPPSATYPRIWTAERKLFTPDQAKVNYIWNDYFLSWNWMPPASPFSDPGKWGEVRKHKRQLYYSTPVGWVPLEPLSRPLHCKPRNITPAAHFGKVGGDFNSCWNIPREKPEIYPGVVLDEYPDEIPNLLAIRDGIDVKFVRVS